MSELRTLSRRQFLVATGITGGGLMLGLTLSRWGDVEQVLAQGDQPFAPNVFISIGHDGAVTLVVSRSEMGQGTRTGMPMILAEELEIDLDQVRIVQADGDEKYGPQLTGGSLSVRLMWDPLRKAGAAARTMLLAAAAETWGVPADECEAREGVVHHRGSERSLPYGDLVDAAARQPVPDEDGLTLKSPGDYRVLGTSVPRLDGLNIVTGKARFGHDTRRPGLKYAAVARCPEFGGRLGSYDERAARAVPGVRGLIELDAFESPVRLAPGVAVIADDTWSAMRGARALNVQWSSGDHATESTGTLRDRFRELAEQPGHIVRNDGDTLDVLDRAHQVVEATYELPFLAHEPMEPMNCTVQVRGRECEIWTPTQNPQEVKSDVASALGLPPSAVTVHVTLCGGGFGRRLYTDAEVEAALIAREVDGPVQVVWTREDDVRHDLYRPSSHHVLRGGLDAQGNLIAWHWRLLNTTTRRFDPEDFPAHLVPNYRVEYSHVPWILPRGAWRSTVNSQNPFVTQCFFDELAGAAGQDPMQWRLQLLRDHPHEGRGYDHARMVKVVEEVASRSGWRSQLPEGSGRGVSFFFGYGSYVAEVAEVSVRDGQISVDRVVCVLDCGQVVNPDLVQAQIEGAIAFGLSAAMLQAITVENGRVQQGNFDDFPTLKGSQMPRIEGHLLPSQESPGGVGETPLPPIAPAVANAVFAATGQRIRRMPLTLAD
jgi:isoquinoline 1-oxidoreductase beta subunit